MGTADTVNPAAAPADFSIQFRELVSSKLRLQARIRTSSGDEEAQLSGNGNSTSCVRDLESGDGFDVTATKTYEYLDREFSRAEN